MSIKPPSIDALLRAIGEKRSAVVLTGLLLLFGTMNVLLIQQNLRLRSLLAASAPQRLKPGDGLEGFTAQSLSGERIDVSYSQEAPKRVLLFFSPRCRYSESQFSAWAPIIQGAAAKKFEVLLLALDSEDRVEIGRFLETAKSPPQAETFHIALLTEPVRDRYNFEVTPTTVVVSNVGTIENVWNGVVSAQGLADAYASLGLNVSP